MMKIFWGVLLALLAFAAIAGVLFLLGVAGVASAVDEAQRQNVQRVQAQVDQWNHEAQQQRQAEALRRADDLRRRQLQPNERCVGGTVITVEGASYTQALGGDLRPVACSGQYRR